MFGRRSGPRVGQNARNFASELRSRTLRITATTRSGRSSWTEWPASCNVSVSWSLRTLCHYSISFAAKPGSSCNPQRI